MAVAESSQAQAPRMQTSSIIVVVIWAVIYTNALAQSPPANLSPRDFDLACAVAAGAEMGASQNEQDIPRRDMAVRIFIFYLGRLSGRDDSKDWNAIAWGRVSELQQEARSSQVLDRCLGFYNSKTK
jgi:hypothetical protein